MSRKKNKKKSSQGIHINKFALSKQIKDGKVKRVIKIGAKEIKKIRGGYVPKGIDRKPKQEAIFGVRETSSVEHFIPYSASGDPDNTISSSNWYVEFVFGDNSYRAYSIKDNTLIRLANCHLLSKKISRIEINYEKGSEILYPFDPLSVNPPQDLSDKVDDIAKELIEIGRLVKQLDKLREDRGNVDYRVEYEPDKGIDTTPAF